MSPALFLHPIFDSRAQQIIFGLDSTRLDRSLYSALQYRRGGVPRFLDSDGGRGLTGAPERIWSGKGGVMGHHHGSAVLATHGETV